jgi:hypothetical protein
MRRYVVTEMPASRQSALVSGLAMVTDSAIWTPDTSCRMRCGLLLRSHAGGAPVEAGRPRCPIVCSRALQTGAVKLCAF